MQVLTDRVSELFVQLEKGGVNVDDFMYMYSSVVGDFWQHAFKNRDTRRYIFIQENLG